MPDFSLSATGPLGRAARAMRIGTFMDLASHVRSLPYGRLRSPDLPHAVLVEGKGTCSSKHRLLAASAHEADHTEIELVVGIYMMSELNTPGVGAVIGNGVIPEAHCYLRIDGLRADFTGLPVADESPFDALVSEVVVDPASLPERKLLIHKAALSKWATVAGISSEEAWKLRELCIARLAANNSPDRSDSR